MKKIIAILLCVCTLFSLSTVAFARTVNEDDDWQNVITTLQYGVSSGYIVTIPESVGMNANGLGTCTLTASDVLLPSGLKLTVDVSSPAYSNGSWHLTNANAGTLNYSITNNGAAVKSGDVVLTVNAGEFVGETVTTVLDLTLTSEATKAGTYSDLLTFNCALKPISDLPITWDFNNSTDGLVAATANGEPVGYKISDWHGQIDELNGMGYTLTMDGQTNTWELQKGKNMHSYNDKLCMISIGDTAVLLIAVNNNMTYDWYTNPRKTITLPERGVYVFDYDIIGGFTKDLGPIDIDAQLTLGISNYDEPMEITDSWDEIAEAVENGTYATKYKIGDYKSMTLTTGKTVTMQLVGMNVDTKTSGGNAALSWVATTWLKTGHVMNADWEKTGGWAESDMRAYLQSDIYATLPDEVKNNIVAVDKTYYDYATQSTLSCSDTLWIPSAREIAGIEANEQFARDGFNNGFEDSGAIYGYLFDAAAKIKTVRASGIDFWWLRSNDAQYGDFHCVYSEGLYCGSSQMPDMEAGIVLGFCM